MKKINEFCEKYISALWCLVAALWFFVEYIFMNPKVDSILSSGFFWVVFSIEEFFRIHIKNKKK